ncbi:M56 family metallopeptidase [Zavarzinella formosa]|uniref:M56 family metallopeptidase n=1 Tax=Zavarzinella formosa TaxID=360055 RepID=UPI0002F7F7A3|nr:M56 family metallopeptidase [Zavarzinella formosa]
MNDLGQAILVLAIQLTFPLLGGLLLSFRRSPGVACSVLMWTVAATWGLTILALLPWPAWPVGEAPSSPAFASRNVNELIDEDEAAPVENPAPAGIDISRILRKLAVRAPAIEEPSFRLGAWLAWGFAGLATLGLIRLVRESRELRRIIADSRPIEDELPLSLLREIREQIGARVPVSLRESAAIDSAATAGIRRPCVLLSPRWRMWTPDELRAALLHEMAHIVRRDFLTRWLVRLTLAVHGYHPLLRWLGRRQELCQELAADAFAANHLAGRESYWRCLASLALKADARPVGMLPTLLGRPKTLFRRIAMLRVMDDRRQSTRRWPALLGVGLLSVAGLSVQGGKQPLFADPITPVKFAEKSPATLDHTYLTVGGSPDHVGVYAVNVADLAQSPGLKSQIAMLNTLAGSLLSGKDKSLVFEIGDVEQLGGQVSFVYDKSKPRPNRSIMNSLSFIRMKKAYDWRKLVEAFSKSFKVHSRVGADYFEATLTVPGLSDGNKPLWLYMPDDRTLVLESEENIKKLIDAKKVPRPAPAWAEDWKSLNQGRNLNSAMFVMTASGQQLAKLMEPTPDTSEAREKELLAILGRIAGKITGPMTLGFQWGDPMEMQIRIASKATDEDYRKLTDVMSALFKDDLAKSKDKKEEDPLDRQMSVVMGRLSFQQSSVERPNDRVTTISLTAKEGVRELLQLIGQSK